MSNIQHEKDTVAREIKKLEAELAEIQKEETEARKEIQEGEKDLQQALTEKTQISQHLQRERMKIGHLDKLEAAEISDKHKRERNEK